VANAQKTPLTRILQRAIASGSIEQIGRLGLCLPGHVVSVSGIMVTVAFDVLTLPPSVPGKAPPQPVASLPTVTIPLASSAYVRLPIQTDDVGIAIPASVLLGSIIGKPGCSTPVLGPDGAPNPSALFWLPIGTLGFSPVNPQMLVLYGPLGVEILGVPPPTGLSVGPKVLVGSSSITLSVGASSIVISASGVTIMGKDFLTHGHLPGTFTADGYPVVGDSGMVV